MALPSDSFSQEVGDSITWNIELAIATPPFLGDWNAGDQLRLVITNINQTLGGIWWWESADF